MVKLKKLYPLQRKFITALLIPSSSIGSSDFLKFIFIILLETASIFGFIVLFIGDNTGHSLNKTDGVNLGEPAGIKSLISLSCAFPDRINSIAVLIVVFPFALSSEVTTFNPDLKSNSLFSNIPKSFNFNFILFSFSLRI